MHPMIVVLALGSGAAVSTAAPPGLQARENQYTRGVLTGNRKLLDDVWAPGLVDADEAGRFATKQQQLARSAHARTGIAALDVDDERTVLYGDTVIVTERFHVRYEFDGKMGDETGRATDVWVKMRGRWMCVAARSSATAPSGKK